jgi:NAD-dependent dihydropyrimidine dehydrogenase PreA subunit
MDEHVKRAKGYPHPQSKILPIPEAVEEPDVIVLPFEPAINVITKARSISIRDCECRMTYNNCDKPKKTCLALNDLSEEFLERGVSEEIPLEEAKKILKIANEQGLVHQVIYADWLKGEVKDMCSCCPCCCTYLRSLINYGMKHHVIKSGLLVKVEQKKCDGCGVCLGRCVFNARKLKNGKSFVVEENCYGCGLCITTCASNASKLISES